MASFSYDVSNERNKLVTMLGSHSTIIEEFVLQSGNMAFDATIDTLVIKFDQEKYKKFLNTNSLSIKLRTNTLHMVRRIIPSSSAKIICFSTSISNTTTSIVQPRIPTSKKVIWVVTLTIGPQSTNTGAIHSAND